MIYQYDKALEEKFKTVFDRVVYAPVDKFYDRYLLQTDNKGSVKLPALSLWRTNYEFLPYNARSQLGTSNFRIAHNDEFIARHIYSMQIKLTYQLDIWASSDIDRDDLLKEILFFIVSYPNISVEYQGEKFSFPVQVETPDDTTDISDFENTGDLYRVSIPLIVPDARLMFYQDVKTCKYIDLSTYVNEDKISDTRYGK